MLNYTYISRDTIRKSTSYCGGFRFQTDEKSKVFSQRNIYLLANGRQHRGCRFVDQQLYTVRRAHIYVLSRLQNRISVNFRFYVYCARKWCARRTAHNFPVLGTIHNNFSNENASTLRLKYERTQPEIFSQHSPTARPPTIYISTIHLRIMSCSLSQECRKLVAPCGRYVRIILLLSETRSDKNLTSVYLCTNVRYVNMNWYKPT